MVNNIINFIPLFSAIIVLGLGLFIFFRKYEFEKRILFLALCFTAFIWLFGTFMMLLNRNNEAVAIFWDRFVYIGVIFAPAVFYHFSFVFSRFNETSKLVIPGYILSFFFLILSRTDYFVSGLFKYQWLVHTKAELFHHLFLIFYFIYMMLTLLNFYRNYKIFSGVVKYQGLYMFISFLFFIGISTIAFLPAYGINIYPFPYFSGMIFVVLLAYLIFVRMQQRA